MIERAGTAATPHPVGLQLPVTAPVTKDQALTIAASLDLPSLAQKTHG